MRNDPARGGESTVAPPLGDIAWGVVLNAVVPVILYKVSKRYYSPSEFAALVMAALFPLGKGTFDLIRHRRLDPIAVVVLLGITTDGVALLFGGSPGLLDRKSTRLNSSHVEISYAVFCLTKKNTTTLAATRLWAALAAVHRITPSVGHRCYTVPNLQSTSLHGQRDRDRSKGSTPITVPLR